ncbi:recombinase family protein [Streptomyces mirabilis]
MPEKGVFSEKISTCVRVRPQFEVALAAAREIKAHAPTAASSSRCTR